jgi:hypothetical protein
MSLLLSTFYPVSAGTGLQDVVLTTGAQTVGGLKTFTDNLRINIIRSNTANPGSIFGRIDVSGSRLFSTNSPSLDWRLRILSGQWRFDRIPTVNGSGVALVGDTNIGGSDTFNGNRPIKRVPSLSDFNNLPVYGGNTISGFLENMFFPYINATISLESIKASSTQTIFNYGFDSPSTGIFNGSANVGDDTILSYQFYRTGVGGVYTQLLQTPSLTPNTPASLGSTFTATSDPIFGLRAVGTRNGQPITLDTVNLQRVRFEPRYYHGLSNFASLTVSNITGLNYIGPDNNSNIYNYPILGKPSSIDITYNNPVNQYLYFIYPAEFIFADRLQSWGAVSSVIDYTNNIPYTTEFENLPNLVPITFPNGKILNYRITRSKNIFNLGSTFNFRFTLT